MGSEELTRRTDRHLWEKEEQGVFVQGFHKTPRVDSFGLSATILIHSYEMVRAQIAKVFVSRCPWLIWIVYFCQSLHE